MGAFEARILSNSADDGKGGVTGEGRGGRHTLIVYKGVEHIRGSRSVVSAVAEVIPTVVVMVLDRPGNQQYIEEVRSAGGALRMIADGDIA